jgi:hypothetical protein
MIEGPEQGSITVAGRKDWDTATSLVTSPSDVRKRVFLDNTLRGSGVVS